MSKIFSKIINEEEALNKNDQETSSQDIFQEYIEELKLMQNDLLMFLENPDDDQKEFKKLLSTINIPKGNNAGEKLEQLIKLLINIANNHHRTNTFLSKIFQILKYYGNQIKENFSNLKIFNMFQSNNIILLFLIENKIITINDNIFDITSQQSHFFYPEIKKFINEDISYEIHQQLISNDSNIFNRFNEKRQEGENDSYICNLILQDSVEEFVAFVSRTNLSLSRRIDNSIFETNQFLNENKNTTLIEYSAFFGSIQIFQFLQLSGVTLEPSLWLYAIHSQNADMIHLLEYHNVEPPSGDYKLCFIEAIKCHHNDIANYIEYNFLQQNTNALCSVDYLSKVFSFHNYAFFPSDLKSEDEFYALCSYDYHQLSDLYIKKSEMNIKQEMKENNFDTLKEAADASKIEIIYYLLMDESEIDDQMFSGNKELRKIVIPSSVTEIDDYSFNGCSSLKQIIIPSSVTYIGDYAFSECTSLETITIPFSVISIGEYAFKGCTSLKKITILSNIQSIEEGTFSGCSSLQNVEIHSMIKSIREEAFYECSSLKTIKIPYSVTSIGENAFYRCTLLSNILIPSSVTKIENNAFCWCQYLVHFKIPSSMTSIESHTFSYCSSLKQVIIPSSVKTIRDCAFCGCSSLKQIIIPSSVTSIGREAFVYCSLLEQITIPSSVTSLGSNAFSHCSSLKKVTISSSLTSIKNSVFNECSSLEQIEIPSSVSSIGDYAFFGCTSLDQIEIPSSVISIGSNAFPTSTHITR